MNHGTQDFRLPVVRGILGALALLVIFAFAGCAKHRDNNELVVGMDLSYPPFETIDASGRPMGISVELAAALAHELGRTLRIENIPFTGLIPSLNTGKIDCIISSMTDSPERRKSIAFSDPYLTTGLAMLAGKSSRISTLQDADQPGRTLVVRQGTTGEVWAREHIRKASILAVDKESSAVLEVVQAKADAFIYDQMSVWQNAQKQTDWTVAILTPLDVESWAIGVRQDNETLRLQINDFLKRFRADGGFNKLGDKFLSEQKQAFEKVGIPFYF